MPWPNTACAETQAEAFQTPVTNGSPSAKQPARYDHAHSTRRKGLGKAPNKPLDLSD